MSSIVVAGDVSGSVTLQAPSASGSSTLTLPAVTDTLVGKATTDTLTNKTLTSPTLTTPILGTPASGTLTNATGLPLASGVTGTLPVANGGTGLTAIGASGTRLLSDGANAAWQGTWFKIGSFTRDISIASGTQAVTGLGFRPKAIIFIGGQTGSGAWSIGYADGTTSGALVYVGPTISTGNALGIDQAAGNTYFGGNPSLDADGFTITWTKLGVPSGTYTFNYLALR